MRRENCLDSPWRDGGLGSDSARGATPKPSAASRRLAPSSSPTHTVISRLWQLRASPLAWLSTVPLLGACQSYNQQIDELVGVYSAGDFAAAAEIVDSGDLDEAIASETDGLLFQLEAAKVLQDAGRFAESSLAFDRAYARLEHFDYQADVSVSEELVSAVGTQSSRDYRGTDYDRILVEVYETLNYLAVGDLGEALVHVRRAYRRQAEAVARNSEEIAAREEDGNKAGKRALEHPNYKAFEESLDTLTTDAYADFVNPVASFLSAVLLREEGSNSNALVDLRKLVGMLPENTYLPALLEEFEAGPAPVPGRFYVIHENGLAPRREEWSITLPSPNGLSRFAIPRLVPTETEARALEVSAADGSWSLETERLASVTSIVATDFKVHLPGLIWRTVIAQVAKEGTTAALANQDKTGLVRLAGSIFKVTTAGADLRTWRTLGAEFQMAYGEVPADGRLSLALVDPFGSRRGGVELQVPPARTTIVYVRTPRLSNLAPHVFSIGKAAARPLPTAPSPETTPDA